MVVTWSQIVKETNDWLGSIPYQPDKGRKTKLQIGYLVYIQIELLINKPRELSMKQGVSYGKFPIGENRNLFLYKCYGLLTLATKKL